MKTFVLQLATLELNAQVDRGTTVTDYQKGPDDDVLIQLQHDNGVIVTFLSAPKELFSDNDDLSPLIFWLDESEVFLAFNESELNRMIQDSIDLNRDTYGEQAAAFLPLQHMIQIGLSAIGQQINGK